MMKTTTTKNVTKLIVVKPFTYFDMGGGKVTLKAGRVLETVKHAKFHYYPWNHKIVMGHGVAEVVPAENLKVKWFKETKTVAIKTKEIKVK
jgi:hypothetical protein